MDFHASKIRLSRIGTRLYSSIICLCSSVKWKSGITTDAKGDPGESGARSDSNCISIPIGASNLCP
eukprot:9034481-Karenia_brevis.AAC.1